MDGIAWAASAMIAARTRLEIATENLANVSTDGFRRLASRGFLTARGVTVERRTAGDRGALRHTGRDLDLAIVGDGAFRISDGSGAVRETRAGAFERQPDGTLRDARGGTLLGAHGAFRGSRFNASAFELPGSSRVQTGYLETSGVDAIAEMIDVLAAERSFESAQKALTAIDASRQKSSDAARVK